MNEELIAKLKAEAKKEVSREDAGFNAWDYSGGNFDDAWDSGAADGRIELAREILESLGIKWSE